MEEALKSEINQERLRNQAFFKQIGYNSDDLWIKLGNIFSLEFDKIINKLKDSGLFGILEALLYLGFSKEDITTLFGFGYVEPYNDPEEFINAIWNIIGGMSKEAIQAAYGKYLSEEKIKNMPTPNKNIQTITSFYYADNDMYGYAKSSNNLVSKYFDSRKRIDHDYYREDINKDNPKIDGRLFRVIRFLVNKGYDFPELEDLFDEKNEKIELKESSGKETITLDKNYILSNGDKLLELILFLDNYDYKIENFKDIFSGNSDDIIFFFCMNGEQLILSRKDLVDDITSHIEVLNILKKKNFAIHNVPGFFDKRVTSIETLYKKTKDILVLEREAIQSVTAEDIDTVIKGFGLSFEFPNSISLFDKESEVLETIDPNGNTQLVVKDTFKDLLLTLESCKTKEFTISDYKEFFDQTKDSVEIMNKRKKKIIANKNHLRNLLNIYSLLIDNDYSPQDYQNLFDYKQNDIYVFDERKEEPVIRILNRKQLNKISNVIETNEHRHNLTESEEELLFIIRNDVLKSKLFEWLPYTAKKWIPSPAVIYKIPAEKSDEYFCDNYIRLGKLKELYNVKKYEDMEGIISLGYMLGLFDSKQKTSEKAMQYIIEHFYQKGVTTDELHTTYGAINLENEFNKNFADFFMIHYAKNSEAFIEPDLRLDMTVELFESFDEILKSRPEKKIKTRTRNKLLTPKDAIAAILTSNVDKELMGDKSKDIRFIKLVELLLKFGASKDELYWSMRIFEEALKIDESKVKIPFVEDDASNYITFHSHLKSDPQTFLSGKKTNCCSKYGGYAEDRLTHTITDKDWRYITFTSPNKTFFDGLVWYDKVNQMVCIDNVEGSFSKKDYTDPKNIELMSDAIIRYATAIYKKMKELKIPCKKMNVGNDDGTKSWEIFSYALKKSLINEDSNPSDYPYRNGISTDARNQFTITNDTMLKQRGLSI